MKETIEVDTGFTSSSNLVAVRIYATDLVVLAKAMRGHEYLDLCITDGVRRIANIEMLIKVEQPGQLCDAACNLD
jgi:hypothetical protein